MINLHDDHLEIVKKILNDMVPHVQVFVFGSRATADAKDHSDLDLAIKSEKPVDKNIIRNLKVAFEESDLPFRVDVVDMAAADSNFRKIIENQAVLFR